MHVQANYSQQLASLGASRNEARDEIQEITERRSAVRRRLAAASGAMHTAVEEQEAAVGAVAEHGPGGDWEGHDPEEEGRQFGRYFSVRA